MKKQCEISGENFTVTPWERDFLARIAPQFDGARFELPLTTMSPMERARLRTIHRNEQHLYRTKSAFSGEPLISIYPLSVRSPIVSREEWFSDSWDAIDHGFKFNSARSFFEQFKELQNLVPRAATVTFNNENSDFTTGTGYCKNCYLINSSEHCEDCYYSKLLQNCKDVVDSPYCYDSELLYQCFNLRNCYDCKWVYNSQQCHSCWFSDDLRNCKNCLFCTNLVGKEHYVLNQKVSAEEFNKWVKEISSGNSQLKNAVQQFEQLRQTRLRKYAEIVNCQDCSGDFLRNSKNCAHCYDVVDSEDCMHTQVGVRTKDLLDCSNMYLDPELSYSVLGTISTNNVHFCMYVFHSSDLWYCEQCFSCHNCFGCVGLRNKEYCIFNQQYDRKTYDKEVRRIIEAMQSREEWGKFFPAALSPFPYNKSLAHEYFPLSKENALAKGYDWEDPEASEFQAPTAEIPIEVSRLTVDFCKEVLACTETGRNYRIQTGELKFYQKLGLPIPNLCPDVRYEQRMQLRNDRQLWNRNCEQCGVEVASTYAPEAGVSVLCEKHYQQAAS